MRMGWEFVGFFGIRLLFVNQPFETLDERIPVKRENR